MKKIVLLLALIGILSILNAIQFTLTPRYVSQGQVEATLSMYNDTSNDVQLEFPNTNWVTLLIDGESSGGGGFDVMTYIQIPAGETITQDISCNNSLILGQHTAQAALYLNGSEGYSWYPVGEPVDILVHLVFAHISFEFNVETISQDYLTMSFRMINNDEYEFRQNFVSNWFTLNLDDVAVNATASQIPGNLSIAAGSEFTSTLMYNPTDPIPYGQHQLVLHIAGYGSLPSQVINVTNPSGIDDQQNSPLASEIYPNPFRDEVNISYVKDTLGSLNLEVYNIKGQMIYHNSQAAKSGSNILQWNGKDMHDTQCPAGVYILSLKDGTQSHQFKCLKVE